MKQYLIFLFIYLSSKFLFKIKNHNNQEKLNCSIKQQIQSHICHLIHIQQHKHQSAYLYVTIKIKNLHLNHRIIMSKLNQQLKKLQAKQGIKFKTGFMNSGAKKLMTNKVFSLTQNQDGWILDSKLYVNNQFDKIFQFMTDANIKALIVSQNLHKDIIKELIFVTFWNLKQLNLSKNNIESIESIVELNTPSLNKIDLSYNQINSIKPINKFMAPVMHLQLQGNTIIDIQKMVRCSFLQLKSLQLQKKHKQVIIGESLIWLMKMPCRQLGQLYCLNRKRIKQDKLYVILAQKYPRGRIALC